VLLDSKLEWRGAMNLKSYHAKLICDISDTRDEEDKSATPAGRGTDVLLDNGKLKLASGSAGFAPPANYIPGAWLPLVLNKLPGKPMLIRTDLSLDYSFAEPTALLSVMIRPEPNTARDDGEKLKCISLEVCGTGEKSRWFYRADGTLDGTDAPQGQRSIRRDQHDISMDFSRNAKMRP
jgi:hypothetical protein